MINFDLNKQIKSNLMAWNNAYNPLGNMCGTNLHLFWGQMKLCAKAATSNYSKCNRLNGTCNHTPFPFPHCSFNYLSIWCLMFRLCMAFFFIGCVVLCITQNSSYLLKRKKKSTPCVPECLLKVKCEKWRTNKNALELHLRTELFLKHAPFKSHQTDGSERKEKVVRFGLCCYVARQLHMFLHHLTGDA